MIEPSIVLGKPPKKGRALRNSRDLSLKVHCPSGCVSDSSCKWRGWKAEVGMEYFFKADPAAESRWPRYREPDAQNVLCKHV